MILAINWTNAFSVVVIGFGLVFIVLVLLIYILRLFGYFATKESRSVEETIESKADEKGITDGECAAIAMALSLFYADVHDQESYVITFADNVNTSWNLKNFGLNDY